MVTMRRNRGGKARWFVMGVVSALVLAGCAETGQTKGGEGSGEGVKYGATKADYKAAFAKVDKIKLNTQSPAPKGSVTGKNVEAYLKAVTEWSGGKITWDIAYSNAVAPPAEIDDALTDGRLDLGQVLPIYEPSDYPATTALIDTEFVSDQSPVLGTLQSNAWPNEMAFDTPEIQKEFEDHGMKVLMPIYDSGANVLFCGKDQRDLASLKGAEIGSGGRSQSAEIKGLGASPASVPYTELFESLQRGAVDCTVSSMTVGVLGGFISAAPNIVVDTDAGFSLAPGSMAISKSTWDSLPLVAQQLLWDRMDVFVKSNIEDKIWPNIVAAAKKAKASGGGIKSFKPDAAKAINKANDKILKESRSTKAIADGDKFVDGVTSSASSWKATLEKLGYKKTTDYNAFAESYEKGKIDVDPYVKKVFEKIVLPHRPS
jgi:TRAP-type C4-dicarboxylate transport system substrate-binding protein